MRTETVFFYFTDEIEERTNRQMLYLFKDQNFHNDITCQKQK